MFLKYAKLILLFSAISFSVSNGVDIKLMKQDVVNVLKNDKLQSLVAGALLNQVTSYDEYTPRGKTLVYMVVLGNFCNILRDNNGKIARLMATGMGFLTNKFIKNQ